jgi:hypothetical protein
MLDLQVAVAAEVRALVARDPEAVSVLVVAPAGVELDAAMAAHCGPLVAGRIYPERSFGAVLNVEQGDRPSSFIVDVMVVWPLSAVRFDRGNHAR